MPQPVPAQGHPDAIVCRWCDTVKVKSGIALLCTRCDAPDHTLATWQRRKSA